MKKCETGIILNPAGIDEASETVSAWLRDAGAERTDIIRIRLTIEDILLNISDHTEETIRAELSFFHRFGADQIRIRYGGDRFDPLTPEDQEIGEFTASLLAGTGILPVWRWRYGTNEVIVPVSDGRKRSELIMPLSIAGAVTVGLLGPMIPESVRTVIIDYVLSFLSQGFLNLLNTFIGIMIFLTVITGICGIGDTVALGRVGKQMMIRFIAGSVLGSEFMTVGVRLFFRLDRKRQLQASEFTGFWRCYSASFLPIRFSRFWMAIHCRSCSWQS